LQVERIKSRIKVLKTQPKSGKIVPEVNRIDIRELVYGNYRIVYKIVSQNRIDVLTIHHSARDLTTRNIQFK
jgi:toxin ParE1/3/4